jgi:hypothetical protein
MSVTLNRRPLSRAERPAPASTRDLRAAWRTWALAWVHSVQEERRGRVRVEPPIRGLWTAGGHAGVFGAAYLLRRRRQER